jgi:hypothetical protein
MLNIHYISARNNLRFVRVIMFRTFCVVLGMGIVVNFSFAPSLWAAEGSKKAHSPAYSYKAPVSAPASEPPAPAVNGYDSIADIRSVLSAQPSAPIAPNRMETRLEPSEPTKSDASVAASAKQPGEYLEIEVSHPHLTLDLYLNTPDGQRKELCTQKRVALGNRQEFPTPPGTYYVTHIYDDKPWWIPPKDRAWAAGDSPSQKVYGGTMAPLLKKRPLRQKKQATTPYEEDLIAYEVQLNDDGYRFHGTNAKRSIGSYASHGCVRMLPDDAKEVADRIKEYVGVVGEGSTENGKFVILRAPVRLEIVK